jgi:glycosyltransferase involved in cell wall biosynthesis
MKILLVHNYYQIPGGEDVVFAAERQLLLEHGHEVIEYTVHNDAIERMNRLNLAANTIWSMSHRRELAQLIAREKPDVAHFHNTFMLISPAAYYACRTAGVPVIQTLHNYRLLCPAATFFRDGQPCEDCLGKFFPWPGVVHACYRDSKATSAVVAGMLATHRGVKTWRKAVSRYIVLTEFARRKFIEGGFDPAQLVIKPNFLNTDPGLGQRDGGYMVFAGRLMPEKGVLTMLDAWCDVPDIPLKIIGDGPLLDTMRQRMAAGGLEHVELLGRQPREETLRLIQGATSLVFPSEWYEGLPMTIVEAYACGLPVLASRLGAMESLVVDGQTGLHFNPRDPADLAARARQLWDDPSLAAALGRQARQVFEAEYTAERNYDLLMDIYASVTSG